MNEIITFTIKHGVIKMVKSVTQYFTEDGTAFDTYEEALKIISILTGDIK